MWWTPILPPFKATDVASFTESVEICPTGISRGASSFCKDYFFLVPDNSLSSDSTWTTMEEWRPSRKDSTIAPKTFSTDSKSKDR